MVRLEAADSTNDVAQELADAGAEEGTVVVADEQRRGRGRRGRSWHAPPGANLSCSVILRPGRERREWPDLSWTLAAAVAETAVEAGATDLFIKYPNDVVAAGRKLAGLLLETRSGPGCPPAVVAGIGVNVNVAEVDFPEELRGRATSLLLLTGRRLPLDDLTRSLLGAIDRWYRLWQNEGAAGVRRRIAGAGFGFWEDGGASCGALEERGEDHAARA